MRFLVLIFLLALFIPGMAVAAKSMTVAQAYKFGHYKRTPFDAAQSTIKSPEEIQFLQNLFQVSDNVMLARVLVLNDIYADRGSDAVNYSLDMDALHEHFKKLPEPEKLAKVKQLMLELMREQQDFMVHWASSTPEAKRKIEAAYSAQPAVQGSNRKVQQMYAELIKLYPGESEYNKQAFFDHLFALDLFN